MLSKLNNIWDEVLSKIKPQINDSNIFDNFLSATKLVNLEGDTATISVPSKFTRELLVIKYLDLIQNCLCEVTESNFKCIIKEEKELIETAQKNEKIQ